MSAQTLALSLAAVNYLLGWGLAGRAVVLAANEDRRGATVAGVGAVMNIAVAWFVYTSAR